MFNVEPNREPDRSQREPSTYRAPLAAPPAKPRTWWGTVPGQLALIAMLAGVVVIALGAMGIIGPLSMR